MNTSFRLSPTAILARKLLQELGIKSIPIQPEDICKSLNIELRYEPFDSIDVLG